MARGCVNNTITQNTVEGNNEGINFSGSSRNVVFCNNFISNTTPAVMLDSTNLWDVGYPGGGNFWSDYLWVDVYWGPSQDRPGSDGIGDTPYTIDSQNQDRYPLISPISATQDQNPPFVGLPSRTPETEIGPSQEVEVSVIAIDRESGLKNVTLWYSVDDGSIWYPLTMEYNLSSSLYQTVIPTQQAFAQVKYRIVAFDNSANKAEQDNVGQYFTYKVIPEYATTMIAVIFIVLTTSAFLSSRKHRPDCAKKKTRV
jgi:parallel beta-helix repeat protein